MNWTEVRGNYPDQWLVVEALEAHSESRRRVVDRFAVLNACPDGLAAWRRYRELRRENRQRELYPVHTSNTELEIEEVECGFRGPIWIDETDASP